MTTLNYTSEQIKQIVIEAQHSAFQEAKKFIAEVYNNQDQGCCGFAWVNIYGIKGNTKLGKAMKAAGIERSDYKKCFSIWNPSEHGAQNIDTKEAGALAAQKVFEKYGFRAYAGSRLD